MRHGSLFSGIGGFDLAAEWMGWENVFHCEWNPFGQKVLKYHFPKAISYDDITKTDFTIHRGTIDILTGGFPCQPYSTAGLRKGKEDERHLWPEMLRAIREIQPRWVVGENVFGLISWGGDWYSTRFKLTWRLKGTKYSRMYFRLSESEEIKSGTGFGLLPTAAAWDGKMYKVTWEAAQKRHLTGSGEGRKLNGGIKKQMGWIHKAILFYGFKKCSANPRFSMWMMGFPLNWTELPFQNGLKKQ